MIFSEPKSLAEMGRYSQLGRFIGALGAFGLAALGAYTLVTPTAGGAEAATGLSIYTICVSPLLFVVEMPTLCKCFKFCNILSKYTKWIAGTWILRAVLYILIAAGAFAIYVVSIHLRQCIMQSGVVIISRCKDLLDSSARAGYGTV